MTKAPPKRGHVESLKSRANSASGSPHPIPRRDCLLDDSSHGSAFPVSRTVQDTKCVNRVQTFTKFTCVSQATTHRALWHPVRRPQSVLSIALLNSLNSHGEVLPRLRQ